MSGIKTMFPLSGNLQWPTLDPFLFCVHHNDAFPHGNGAFGPDASLAGRQLGMDFELRDGWRMYHGHTVPGFPQHPHRGFETVTVVRRGLIDHSDSLGGAARYGQGDVQWMTAGAGIMHAEMFPLVHTTRDNPVELFQLWLNLPARDKMAPPEAKMLWAPEIPHVTVSAPGAPVATLSAFAGALTHGGKTHAPPAPPARSWAADKAHGLHVWTLKLAPGAEATLPAAAAGVQRMVYAFDGGDVLIGNDALSHDHGALLEPGPHTFIADHRGAELLILGGTPIGEPVVQHGPYVMNTPGEIRQAMRDFGKTRFGGWPWSSSGPVHKDAKTRFYRTPDGTVHQGPALG